MMSKFNKKKKVLLVEDDDPGREYIIEKLESYLSDIEVMVATNAGEAIDYLSKEESTDALILDIMMPYGNAYETLGGESDLDQIDTGIRLLRYLYNQKSSDQDQHRLIPHWIAVITARIDPQTIEDIREMLGENGHVYVKPLKFNLLENDLTVVLGIESQVLEAFLPYGYQPPKPRIGSSK